MGSTHAHEGEEDPLNGLADGLINSLRDLLNLERPNEPINRPHI